MLLYRYLSTAIVASLAAGAAQAAAPAITSFTPTAGGIGSKFVLTGTAFTGATSVTIGGVAAGFTVGSATQITATLPATAGGRIAVTTPGGSGASSASFTVTPGVIGPVNAHPSASTAFTGSGFTPYTPVDVYFDTVDTALTVSNGSGVVTATINIPASAQPGNHWITLVGRANQAAAQVPVMVVTNWAQGDYGQGGANFNPFENTLNTSNVGQLDALWAAPEQGYSNATPIVEANNVLFAQDINGVARAFSSTGTLIWKGSTVATLSIISPVVSGAFVYFGSGTKVFAYKVACNVNGGTCTPAWTATISAGVISGLTLFNNVLYAPAGDGQVYPINPTTGALSTPFYAYSNSEGGIYSPVRFTADGTFVYANSGNLQYKTPFGGAGNFSYPNGVSGIAIQGNNAFYTSGDGYVHSLFGNQWSTATSGTYCYATPAVAYGNVYAGGCTTLGAYATGTGIARWVATTSSQVYGVAVANGVVYACVGQVLYAYDASYGSLLWSGGFCSYGDPPVVVNGVLYANSAEIYAYTLPSLLPNAMKAQYAASRKPVVASLRRDLSLVAQRTPERP